MPSRLVTKKLNFSVVAGAELPATLLLPAAGAGALAPAGALVPALGAPPVRPAVVGVGLLLPAAGRPATVEGGAGAVVPAAAADVLPATDVTAFEPAPPAALVVPAVPDALLVFAGAAPQPNPQRTLMITQTATFIRTLPRHTDSTISPQKRHKGVSISPFKVAALNSKWRR